MPNKENETKLRNYLNNTGMSKQTNPEAEKKLIEEMKKMPPPVTKRKEVQRISGKGTRYPATPKPKHHF